MDWVSEGRTCVDFITGITPNTVLLKNIDKPLRRWQKAFDSDKKQTCHYYSFKYKAGAWKQEQRVIAKIEFTKLGSNVKFTVTSNRNYRLETLYRRYAGRGEMELWIKDYKALHGDRMSCGSYRANYFRLFLYVAAQILLYDFRHIAFEGTEVEYLTIDSFIKRIMLGAVMIREQKCAIKVHFMYHHRYLAQIVNFLQTIS